MKIYETTRLYVREMTQEDLPALAAIHQKFVLIDKRLVWYGSLNLLSYGASEESLMRLASREVAAELQASILLDEFRQNQ